MSSEQTAPLIRKESTRYASKYIDITGPPKFSHIRVPPVMTSEQVQYMIQQQDDAYDPLKDPMVHIEGRMNRSRRRFSVVLDGGQQATVESTSVAAVVEPEQPAASQTRKPPTRGYKQLQTKTATPEQPLKPSIEVSRVLVETSKRLSAQGLLDAEQKAELRGLLTPTCFTCGRNLQQPLRERLAVAKAGCSTCATVSFAEKTQKQTRKDSRLEKEFLRSSVGPGKYVLDLTDIGATQQRRLVRVKETSGGFDSHTGSLELARARAVEKFKKDRRQLVTFLQDVVARRHLTQRKAAQTLTKFDAKFTPSRTRQPDPVGVIVRGNWQQSGRPEPEARVGEAAHRGPMHRDTAPRVQPGGRGAPPVIPRANMNSLQRTRGFLVSLQNSHKK